MSKNKRKENFLASLPQASIEATDDTLAARCKFNFSYFCEQQAGQDFADWEHDKLCKLLDKLKEYGRHPLRYWLQQTVGRAGTVLAIYGGFPLRSDFSHPSHVPHQVRWGRFRIDQATRLIGFVLPEEYDGRPQPHSGVLFDSNTFYIVFLDQEHRFYKTEQK